MLYMLLSLLMLPTHDIQVSFFKLYKQQEVLVLEIHSELDDFVQAIGITQEEINPGLLTKFVHQYFEIRLDDQEYQIVVDHFEITAKHIDIKARVVDAPDLIHHIDIKNTYLLDIEDQSNIIEIRIHDQERDFLMDQNRTQIQIKL